MIVAYIDGGARGNPGPAGFGVRIEQSDGTLVEEFHESIGTATNNVAEYRALIAALEWARSHGHHDVRVKSDSRLLVLEIGHVTFEHVGRALNAHADRLANEAMDLAAGTGIAKPRGASTPGPHPPAPASEADPFSSLERAVRLFVYDHFVKTTKAPDLAAIT